MIEMSELAQVVGVVLAVGGVGVSLGVLIAEVKGLRRDLATAQERDDARHLALEARVIELERARLAGLV